MVLVRTVCLLIILILCEIVLAVIASFTQSRQLMGLIDILIHFEWFDFHKASVIFTLVRWLEGSGMHCYN